MLIYEDGSRKFSAVPYLKVHCSETIITNFFFAAIIQSLSAKNCLTFIDLSK